MLLINFPTIQIVLRYSVLLLKTKDTELGNKICIVYCEQTRDLNRKLYLVPVKKKNIRKRRTTWNSIFTFLWSNFNKNASAISPKMCSDNCFHQTITVVLLKMIKVNPFNVYEFRNITC